ADVFISVGNPKPALLIYEAVTAIAEDAAISFTFLENPFGFDGRWWSRLVNADPLPANLFDVAIGCDFAKAVICDRQLIIAEVNDLAAQLLHKKNRVVFFKVELVVCDSQRIRL